jgi:hypothetical protein
VDSANSAPRNGQRTKACFMVLPPLTSEAFTSRKAMFRQRKATLGLTSAGNRPGVLAGTRKNSPLGGRNVRSKSLRRSLRAPEGQTRVHKP